MIPAILGRVCRRRFLVGGGVRARLAWASDVPGDARTGGVRVSGVLLVVLEGGRRRRGRPRLKLFRQEHMRAAWLDLRKTGPEDWHKTRKCRPGSRNIESVA